MHMHVSTVRLDRTCYPLIEVLASYRHFCCIEWVPQLLGVDFVYRTQRIVGLRIARTCHKHELDASESLKA